MTLPSEELSVATASASASDSRNAALSASPRLATTRTVDLAGLHSLPVWQQNQVFAESEAEVAHAIVHDLADNNPEMAARYGIRGWQKLAGLSSAAFGVIAALLAPSVLLLALLGITSGIVLITFILSVAGLLRSRAGSARRQLVPELADEQLPTYTVLVPAYREEEVIGAMVKCLAKLDYPPQRLEVLLLVERGDIGTQRAIAAAGPPAYMRVLQVPSGPPRTKPRSCNAGLLVANGELLTIFDAEDRPEPDQLRRAAAVFAANSTDLACVQAELRTGNERTNLLTHCFGVEYALRSRLILPGLVALGVPFPPCGTSNHFRTQVVRDVGGWDAWNVSEDADLGMRLHTLGYRMTTVDSVTFTDATDRLRDWIWQRTRWHKGYLLTALIHTRAPLDTVQRFGVRGLVGLMTVVLGTPLQFLVQPVISALGISGSLGFRGLIHAVYADTNVISAIQFATLLIWLIAAYLACVKPRRIHLLVVAALPVYWLAHWFAAWRALYQLVTAPFVWEKTAHHANGATESATVTASPGHCESTSRLTGICGHGN